MNWIHNKICRSDRWKKRVREDLLPWVLGGVDLGREPLEIGPGFGVVTDLLRMGRAKLTCLEIDPELASALAGRLVDTNVVVREGDASDMPFPEDTFSGAASFTMLHHVPSASLQDRVLTEAYRVIRPGAWFAGTDSRSSLPFRLIHINDIMVICDPDTFGERMMKAGFRDVAVTVEVRAFAFRGRKPQS